LMGKKPKSGRKVGERSFEGMIGSFYLKLL
jgi:hypothetical protein